MQNMNDQEWMEKLKAEGYGEIEIHPFEPHAELAEHTHDRHTMQVILEGELTVYDSRGSKLYRVGDRLESPAGTTHHAKVGPAGCKFIIGVK